VPAYAAVLVIFSSQTEAHFLTMMLQAGQLATGVGLLQATHGMHARVWLQGCNLLEKNANGIARIDPPVQAVTSHGLGTSVFASAAAARRGQCDGPSGVAGPVEMSR
jgi:hypothetical protein